MERFYTRFTNGMSRVRAIVTSHGHVCFICDVHPFPHASIKHLLQFWDPPRHYGLPQSRYGPDSKIEWISGEIEFLRLQFRPKLTIPRERSVLVDINTTQDHFLIQWLARTRPRHSSNFFYDGRNRIAPILFHNACARSRFF